MTHVHICPTEIAIFMMMYDYVKAYSFHYQHIITSAFSKMYDDDCKVCNE